MTIRRPKTFAGSQGYVYQYYFAGKRAVPSSGARESVREYVFDVTSDRKMAYAVSILLPETVVTGWAESHGRSLSDSEQYAALKMRLFCASEELEQIQADGRQLAVDLGALEESLASLGVD
jgi:hypothetical protein